MSSQVSVNASNLVRIKHPHYKGESNPDLSCKICCSKFVAKIRAEQSSKFEATWNTAAKANQTDFQPMSLSNSVSQSSKRKANFDGSWV
jgi:hypothetical protein